MCHKSRRQASAPWSDPIQVSHGPTDERRDHPSPVCLRRTGRIPSPARTAPFSSAGDDPTRCRRCCSPSWARGAGAGAAPTGPGETRENSTRTPLTVAPPPAGRGARPGRLHGARDPCLARSATCLAPQAKYSRSSLLFPTFFICPYKEGAVVVIARRAPGVDPPSLARLVLLGSPPAAAVLVLSLSLSGAESTDPTAPWMASWPQV